MGANSLLLNKIKIEKIAGAGSKRAAGGVAIDFISPFAEQSTDFSCNAPARVPVHGGEATELRKIVVVSSSKISGLDLSPHLGTWLRLVAHRPELKVLLGVLNLLI